MRKLSALLMLVLTCNTYVFATFGAATAWDARTTGATTNGAAFDSGVVSPGTDESQGSGTAITITLTGATTGTGSPAFTSTTHGPGNFVNIASGSGCTTGRFEILSQSSGTATFDHSMGSSTDVCVGVIGGSTSTLADAVVGAVAGNTVYMKSGTYTVSARTTITSVITVAGYSSVHGDQVPNQMSCGTSSLPLITTSTSSVSPLILINPSSGDIPTVLQCLHLTNTAGTPAEAIANGGGSIPISILGLVIDGFTKGVDCDNGTYYACSSPIISWTEIKNSTVYAATFNPQNGCYCATIDDSYIHDNAGAVACNAQVMIESGPPASLDISRSIIANAASSASGVCTQAAALLHIRDSDFVGNQGAGIVLGTSSQAFVENSILYGNGVYGIVASGTSYVFANGNAVGSNTSGNYSNVIPINSIALTANPFVNSSGGNYALNSTAGGGALLLGLGLPALFPGGLSTGSPSVGAVETAGSSSGGSSGYTTVQ